MLRCGTAAVWHGPHDGDFLGLVHVTFLIPEGARGALHEERAVKCEVLRNAVRTASLPAVAAPNPALPLEQAGLQIG